MLQHINTLPQMDRLHAVIVRSSWVAVCQETGAYLWVSSGRPKGGRAPKYGLILPKEKGKLFDYGNWDNEDRKFLRAWSDEEAMQIANEKLEKMLAKREKRADNEVVR